MARWAPLMALLLLSAGDAEAVLLTRISAENGCPVIAGAPAANGANKSWLATGIMIPVAGTRLSLGVEGTIQNQPASPLVFPGGSAAAPAGPGFCAPALPPHSAIGCIGMACLDPNTQGGVIFPIGIGASDIPGIPAPAAGPLFVGVNDDFYDDNLGDWKGAFGLTPNPFVMYLITGASNGVGWRFALTDPGMAPDGVFERAGVPLAIGAGPGAFVTDFARAIGTLGLPNVYVLGAPAGILSISAPGPIEMWLTTPGNPTGTPSCNVNTTPGGCFFNPTITPYDAAGIPAASTTGLIILGLSVLAAGLWVLSRRAI